MREAQLQARIIEVVRAKYPTAYVRKISDRFTRGLADLVIVFKKEQNKDYKPRPVCLLWVEVKKEFTGRLTKLQALEQRVINERLNAENCKAIVARSVETVLEEMERMGA